MTLSKAWWDDFEARVDKTGVKGDPLFELGRACAIDFKPARWPTREDFAAIEKQMFGDPENKEPIFMDVYTTKGWMKYTFELKDLEQVPWKELGNVIATEGPRNFREVVVLAKSAYESRCGYMSPTIQRLPDAVIRGLII